MRLTDWIIHAVETYQMQHIVRYTIPADVDFADLKLARDGDGAVSFDWAPIERICDASGVDVELLRNSSEDNVSTLIVQWYQAHLANGGARDAVQDDLIAETIAEERVGQTVSLPPGRA